MPAHTTITARIYDMSELKQTPSGSSYCKLKLPVDTGYGDKKTTTWWTATLWGKSAETAVKHLSSGRWVCVSGEAQVRTWENNDGSTGFAAELRTNGFSFVGNKSDNVGNKSDNAQQAPAAATPRRRFAAPNIGDGDLPF